MAKRTTSASTRRQLLDRRNYSRYLPDGRPQCQAETTRRKQCTNPAGPGSSYCRSRHKYGKSYVARPAASRSAQGAQARSTQRRPAQYVSLPVHSVPRAIQIARAVETASRQGWGAYAKGYVVQQVGTQGWARLESRWRTPNCKKLAALAAQLDRAGSSSGLGFLEGVPLIQELVQPLHPIAGHARQAAMLLRALGVAVCAAHGSVKRCACLKAMIDSYGDMPDLIVSLLRQAIPITR